MEFQIKLNTEKEVVSLVNIMNKYDFDIDAKVEHYIFDAKSVLGVMALAPGRTISIKPHADDTSSLENDLQRFRH